MKRSVLFASLSLLVPALASAHTVRLAGLPQEVIPSSLMPATDHLFVVGMQNGFPNRLWVTDGTAETSHLVTDAEGRALHTPQTVTVFQDHLYFSAEAAGTGTRALYRMEGSTPQLVAASSPSRAYAGEDCFYFGVSLPGGYGQLWRSDGTAAGTQPVGAQMGGLPSEAAVLGTSLLFTWIDAGGLELWKAEGNSVARLVDIAPGAAGSAPAAFARVGNLVTFSTRGGPAARGGELWKTDGTAVGTQMVKAINPGADSGGVWSEDPHANAGTLFFRAIPAGGPRAVWKTDGTSAGTVQIAAIAPPVWSWHPFVSAGATTFFVGQENGESSLYSTDGTTAGTMKIAPHSSSTFTVRGNKLFVAGATQIWSTTGTAASVVVEGEKPEGGLLGGIATAAGRIFAVGTDPTYGTALWVLDESDPGTPDAGVPDAGASDAGTSSSSGGGAEDAGASSSSSGSSSGRSSSSSSSGNTASSGGRPSGSSGSSGAGESSTGGTAPGDDDDDDGVDGNGEGGCSTHSGSPSLPLVLLGAAVFLVRRRRGRASAR